MENDDGVLLVEMYRDSTDSYMETIVPKELVLDFQSFDDIRIWAEMELPQFECILTAEDRPCIKFKRIDEIIDWLTDIGCPE